MARPTNVAMLAVPLRGAELLHAVHVLTDAGYDVVVPVMQCRLNEHAVLSGLDAAATLICEAETLTPQVLRAATRLEAILLVGRAAWPDLPRQVHMANAATVAEAVRMLAAGGDGARRAAA